MRTTPLSFIARRMEREPVPFRAELPLKLRPFVSGKSDSSTGVSCIYEMTVMLACFKTNEFNDSSCSKEIAEFQKCATFHAEEKRLRKAREAKGILTPGEKKLSYKQVNILLKKHPNW